MAGNRLFCLFYGPFLLFGYLTADGGAVTLPAQGGKPEVTVIKPRVLLVAMHQRVASYQFTPWDALYHILRISFELDACALPLCVFLIESLCCCLLYTSPSPRD